MMRKWLVILLVLPILSGCEPVTQAWQGIKDWVQNWHDVPAPNARDFMIQPLPQVAEFYCTDLSTSLISHQNNPTNFAF